MQQQHSKTAKTQIKKIGNKEATTRSAQKNTHTHKTNYLKTHFIYKVDVDDDALLARRLLSVAAAEEPSAEEATETSSSSSRCCCCCSRRKWSRDASAEQEEADERGAAEHLVKDVSPFWDEESEKNVFAFLGSEDTCRNGGD